MKLKLMLMRMAEHSSRVNSDSGSDSETSYNGSSVVNVKRTAVPDYDGPTLYSNPRTWKRSCDSLLIGTCHSPRGVMYSPFSDGFYPLSGDNYNPVIGTCNFPFESSSFYGRPLSTHNTSNVADFIFHTSGNHFINTETQTGMLLTENNFPMPHIKETATPNRAHGVFSQTRCKWEDCNDIVESDLIRHLHNAHLKDSKEDGFICRWRNCCQRGKPFNARYKLISHVRSHTNRVFNCAVCSKGFSRKEALKIHLRCHTGERPYPCSFVGCKKTFKSPSDRSKHFKTHQETHPYTCNVIGCTKKYTDPSTRRKHEKTHLKDSEDRRVLKSSKKSR